VKRRPFGKTGITVGEIGFGAWAIGGGKMLERDDGVQVPVGFGMTDDAESVAALERFHELGGNLIDTADAYGAGHSEELIGRFMKGKRREDIVVCTKVGNAREQKPDGIRVRAWRDFSPKYILSAVEASLRRLGTDYIDVYLLHNPADEDRRRGETWDALKKLKRDGKVRCFGISIGKSAEGLETMGFGAEALQVEYNLIDQRPREKLLPAAAEKGVAIMTRVPLASGLLTGKWTKETKFEETDHRSRRFGSERLAKLLGLTEKLGFLTKETGRTIIQAALLFSVSDSAISVSIPGAKRPAQVEENMRAAAAPPLTDEEMRRIFALWDGEFREALGKK